MKRRIEDQEWPSLSCCEVPELIHGAVEVPFVLFWQIASDVRALKHPDNSLVDSSFFGMIHQGQFCCGGNLSRPRGAAYAKTLRGFGWNQLYPAIFAGKQL